MSEVSPELGDLSGDRSLGCSPAGNASCVDFQKGHLQNLPLLKPQLSLSNGGGNSKANPPTPTEQCKSSQAATEQREIALEFHHGRVKLASLSDGG